ncbi:hypothetical protein LQW54_006678 [Pestalotiopsis sp. IQ-011]
MDAAGRFSFGEPLGCLEQEDDVGGSIQLIRDRFNHWGWWSSIPGLERLVYRNPLAMRQRRAPSSMAAAAVQKLKTRSGQDKYDGEHVDLLHKFLEASKDHPEALDTSGVVGMSMSTISGAGDTIATTVTAAIYNLIKNPAALKSLRAELSEAQLPEIPSYSEVSKLPYLNAVIRESMRIFPTPTRPMERLVPKGGATIAGNNTKIFGDDVDVYRPERWLTSNAQELRQMESAHVGFSRGRRVCLGQNIAIMQMKKVIPALVVKFELELVNSKASLEADFSPAVACLELLFVKSRLK